MVGMKSREEAVNRQRRLLNLYAATKKKTTLINGHGVLFDSNALHIVPNKRAIVFLAEPGACMNINTSLGIQNKYFTSNRNFRNFLSGGRRGLDQHHHVADVLSRTHLPGNTYPNMRIELTPNRTRKTMGFLKNIPTKPTAANLTLNNLRNRNFVPGTYRLSNIVDHYGPGVYVVSACRANPEETRDIMNLPRGAFVTPIKPQSRGTSFGRLIRTLPVFKPRKGVQWSKLKGVEPKGAFKRTYRYPKEALVRMSRGLHAKTPANVLLYAPKLAKRLRNASVPRSRAHRSGLVS